MTIPAETPTAAKELSIDALEFAKYPNNVAAMVYLNEVLSELSFSMSAGNFKVMQERVFKIMKENESE